MIDIFAAFDKAISTGHFDRRPIGAAVRPPIEGAARDPKRRRRRTAPQPASRFQAASERSMLAKRLEAFRALFG